MSRYQSSSTRMALTNVVLAQWQQSAVSLCSSAELTVLAEQLASSAVLGGQGPLLPAATRVLADPRLADLARAAGPDIRAQLTTVRTLLPTSSPGLPTAAADLLTNLAPVLARQERDLVADTAVDTLRHLGYTVIRESGPGADGIEARRSHEVMLLAVTDGGELSTDHLGADGACADRQARFEAAMADRGVVMTSRAVDPHDDVDGPLFAAAAAKHEASLALAIARHAVGTRDTGAVRQARAGTSQGWNRQRARALQEEEAE